MYYDDPWWKNLLPYTFEKLKTNYPDYKKLKAPTLDIRWRLDEWNMEAVGYNPQQKKYTNEEVDEIMKKQDLFFEKYGHWRRPEDWDGK